MKKSKLKKTCVAVAVLLGAVCSVPSVAITEPAVSTTQSQASVSELNRISRLQVQEWVNGLQTAFPYYKIQLKEFEEEGENAVAVIEFTLGSPEHASDGIYLVLDYEVRIEHGLAFEDRKVSIARLETETSIDAVSSPELVELFDAVSIFLKDVNLEELTIMRPSGELYSQMNLGSPFQYVDDSVRIDIPVLDGKFETYGGAQFVRGNMVVPDIKINDTDYDRQVVLQGIDFNVTDKPIRYAIYDLNGRTDLKIAQMDVFEEGQTLFSLRDFVYRDDNQVDVKGLLHSQFSMSGSGSTPEINYGSVGEIQQPGSVSFDFEVDGRLSNLSAESYVRLMQYQYNSVGSFDGEQAEGLIFDVLKDGLTLDLDRIDVILNGEKGLFTAHVGVQPFTAQDRKAAIYLLLLQKLEASATMDVPLRWFEIFESDAQEREALLSELVQSGYFIVKDGRLQSSFSYSQGNILVNGKPLEGGFPF